MLVLSRKILEKIIIRVAGETIVIQVCEIKKDKVRLGFEADMSVMIAREEIDSERKKP